MTNNKEKYVEQHTPVYTYLKYYGNYRGYVILNGLET